MLSIQCESYIQDVFRIHHLVWKNVCFANLVRRMLFFQTEPTLVRTTVLTLIKGALYRLSYRLADPSFHCKETHA